MSSQTDFALDSRPGSTISVDFRDDVAVDVPRSAAARGACVFHGPALLRAARSAASVNAAASPVATIRHRGGISIWPLRIVRQLGMTIATDLATPIAQYSDVIGAPLPREALNALTNALQCEYDVDALLARRVRADGRLADAFDAADRIESDAAPYIDLAAHVSFDDYAARFGKQTRRNRNQRRRRLEQAHGPLTFHMLRGADANAEIAMAIHWKRHWLAAQALTSQVFDNCANEATLRAACDEAAVCVSVLRAGHEAIAAEIGFTAGSHYAAYLGAFDPRVARFSVGQEQMLRTIEWCFAQGFARYDLLAPANPYKFGWTDKSVAVHDYCVALTARGIGYAMARKLAQSPMQRRLRDLSPAVRRSARRYGLPAAGLSAAAMALTLAD